MRSRRRVESKGTGRPAGSPDHTDVDCQKKIPVERQASIQRGNHRKEGCVALRAFPASEEMVSVFRHREAVGRCEAGGAGVVTDRCPTTTVAGATPRCQTRYRRGRSARGGPPAPCLAQLSGQELRSATAERPVRIGIFEQRDNQVVRRQPAVGLESLCQQTIELDLFLLRALA